MPILISIFLLISLAPNAFSQALNKMPISSPIEYHRYEAKLEMECKGAGKIGNLYESAIPLTDNKNTKVKLKHNIPIWVFTYRNELDQWEPIVLDQNLQSLPSMSIWHRDQTQSEPIATVRSWGHKKLFLEITLSNTYSVDYTKSTIYDHFRKNSGIEAYILKDGEVITLSNIQTGTTIYCKFKSRGKFHYN